MPSCATFVTTYCTSGVLPSGQSKRLAGIVYAHSDLLARGGSGTPTPTPRNKRVVMAAMRDASPVQPSLWTDYYTLDAA